jgi:hypothetical protein
LFSRTNRRDGQERWVKEIYFLKRELDLLGETVGEAVGENPPSPAGIGLVIELAKGSEGRHRGAPCPLVWVKVFDVVCKSIMNYVFHVSEAVVGGGSAGSGDDGRVELLLLLLAAPLMASASCGAIWMGGT